jgi:excisionase family DNA binding protein
MNLLTTRQAAEMLGLCQDHLRDMAFTGRIPAFRLRTNGHWRFDKEKLTEWINRRTTGDRR